MYHCIGLWIYAWRIYVGMYRLEYMHKCIRICRKSATFFIWNAHCEAKNNAKNCFLKWNKIFEAKKKVFPSFCFKAKKTKLKRSEKFETKRSEKMDLNFLSEQAKHMWNGSNFASFRLWAKNFLKWNGLTLIPAGNWILAGQMVIEKEARGENFMLDAMRDEWFSPFSLSEPLVERRAKR